MRETSTSSDHQAANPWRVVFAGLCASLIANGFGRFAYSPLIPAQIQAGWFTASQTIYFGAANLAGYLIGAVTASYVGRQVPNVPLLRGAMALITVSFFACAAPLSVSWFFIWRLLAGIAGGYLMVLAAPILLPHVPVERRGLAAGAIFLGIGVGIVAACTLIPLLLQFNVAAAWIGLGVASTILTILSWPSWPPAAQITPPGPASAIVADGHSRRLRALYVEYALTAVGQVTHVIFLVDFIARGLGQGMTAGVSYWLAWGIGAMVGPLLAGHVADRVGFRHALRLSLILQMAGVLLPVLSTAPAALLISSVIIGSFVPGSVVLTLGRARELTPGGQAAQTLTWGRCTAAFAIGQALSAYVYSAIFANFGEVYLTIFMIGGAGFALALIIDLAVAASLRGRDEQRVCS